MKKVLFFAFLTFFAALIAPVQAYARPTHLRVGLVSRFSGSSSIAVSNTNITYPGGVLSSADGFIFRPYAANQVAIYGGGSRLRVLAAPVLISDAGNMITLDGHPYRGAIEFARLGSTGLTAINIVSLEEYLLSVVPSEMPASWHPEALKAQAVAARTYALHMVARGSSHTGFDLCDRVCCQVYRGAGVEYENSSNAVWATAGLAAYFNGQLIEAVYFASSGGMTENSENVWQNAAPYLVAVLDPHEFEPVFWTRTFTLNEISHLLTQNRQGFVGAATNISIASTLPSGRVESLIIQGTGGQIVLEREEIRTFFSPSSDGSLMSRNFVIGGTSTPAEISIFDGRQTITTQASGLYIINGNRALDLIPLQTVTVPVGDTITLTGQGFGHGVGMSQRGAEGMARQGYNFRQILSHFYRGISIQ